MFLNIFKTNIYWLFKNLYFSIYVTKMTYIKHMSFFENIEKNKLVAACVHICGMTENHTLS